MYIEVRKDSMAGYIINFYAKETSSTKTIQESHLTLGALLDQLSLSNNFKIKYNENNIDTVCFLIKKAIRLHVMSEAYLETGLIEETVNNFLSSYLKNKF